MNGRELDGRRVAVFQSGGLSSLSAGLWLREANIAARHYIADIGQSSPAEIRELAEAMRALGFDATVVDLRAEMARIAADMLRYRARHDGGYWNTTSASRYVLVTGLAGRMAADGCLAVAHGCVADGNDERRFARYMSGAEPEVRVYAPWLDPAARERFPDRAAMLKAVREAGLPLDAGSDVDRSTDANLAGVSHESAELEELATPATRLTPRWCTWPADAPQAPEDVTVRFTDGQVTDLDNTGPDPRAWLSRGNAIGGRHGVWLQDLLERRISGAVCRGVYEVPGLEVLDCAWRRALATCLDPQARTLLDSLSTVIGEAVYEGRYPDPAARAARTAADGLLAGVTATVSLRAHRGTVVVTSTRTPHETSRQTRFGTGGHTWSVAR